MKLRSAFRLKAISRIGIVQQFYHIGDNVKIGTVVKDSVVQRSVIGAGAQKKFPRCGNAVSENEKFCPECDEQLQ